MTIDRQLVGRRASALGGPSIDFLGGDERRLIVVSNRGPVEHRMGPDGQPEPQRGAGGVVSGLLCSMHDHPATWIALAMNAADREALRLAGDAPLPSPDGLDQITLRLVDVPEDAYRRHYDGISNKVLWFAQHYLLQPTDGHLFTRRTASDWKRGYVAVNDAVADAVIAELERNGTDVPVLFQDYHLYLAPERVRERFPSAQLAHFVHIPWPDARYWEMFPEYITQAIFRGLAANDLLGFQTQRDARNFLEGAERFLEGADARWSLDDAPGTLLWRGRRILPRAYPIAVTPDEVQQGAHSREAVVEAVKLAEELRLRDDSKLIVRVDRVEPTKNIVRGFEAYERLLRAHRELHGAVTFLALLVPSRQSMAEYRSYEQQVRRVIDRVNARFGTPDWQPIVAVFDNNRPRALACMRRYDVLLVNPLIDGMNLVVKEGGLVNARAGVTVLSRTAGAYEQLSDYVLGVPPTDVQATAEALYQALMMSRRERSQRARGLREVLLDEDAALWLETQLRDLERLTSRPRRTSRRTVVTADTTRITEYDDWSPRVAAPAPGPARQPLFAASDDTPRALPR